MVYFECQKCNESVKKPKLAKHLLSCRSHYVTCIDCCTTFAWDEWEGHTSCISEAQKYQGQYYKEKESTNKGLKKQVSWTDNVMQLIEDKSTQMDQETRANLQKLMGFSNIPRKEKAFANFTSNSLRIWDQRRISNMWKVIEVAIKKPAPEASNAENTSSAAQANGKDNEKGFENGQLKVNNSGEGSSTKANGKDDKGTANGQATWAGWKRALDEELEASGGQLKWRKLRDRMVAKCEKNGGTNGEGKRELGWRALSSIPDEYLSKSDAFVRSPNTC